MLTERVIGAAIDVQPRVVVDLKAVEVLNPIHLAQVLSHLEATRARLGLLISFNVTMLRYGIRRAVLTR